MADEEASNPFLPPPDTEPKGTTPEPEPVPRLDWQGDYRPAGFEARRKASPFDWKTFLKWMAVGLMAIWAFALLMVFVAFQMLDPAGEVANVSSGSGTNWLMKSATFWAVALAGVVLVPFGWIFLRKR
jgi:hypothetical protein